MPQNFKLIYLILIVTLFSLIGGGVGEILTRVYVLQDAYNVPMFGELNISGSSGPNLVIRDAKKVVVEQNEKTMETASAVSQSIAGIFKKAAADKTGKTAAAYTLDQETAQGLILTSDGWLITNFIPDAVRPDKNKEPVFDQKNINAVKTGYVVIIKDGRIFEPDNIIYDQTTGYSFWHVNARDLIVKNLSGRPDIQSGMNALALNWDGWIQSAQIIGQKNGQTGEVRASDICPGELVLGKNLNEKFYGTFLFNLNSDLVALIDQSGKVIPVYSYNGIIKSLLKNKTIVRPKLGVNYRNLAEQLPVDGQSRKGALIAKNGTDPAVAKGGPAAAAGLREGDIILSVNNIEIDRYNDLCAVLAGFAAGDEVVVAYERNGESQTIKIKL